MNKHPFHKLPGEKEDSCCWCIPIEPGVYIIGVLVIVYGIWAVKIIIDNFTIIGYHAIQGILWIVSVIPILLAAFFFIQFFVKKTLGKLARACMLVCLSCLLGAAIAIVFQLWYHYPIEYIFNQLMPPVIYTFCYFYFAGVCRRYES